ncbi:MAG: YigZ family protein [Selenomonadaceae bacterium]|nr:YigZ family protein [Selenomonadaceae bacterium]
MVSYQTIEERDDRLETEYVIQKSRFLTHLAHVETEEEARAFVQKMKKRFYDARHNCSAWVLGPKAELQKSNDDGEPGGTAGNPILEAIKKRGLTDVVLVVTRYFGGIKLGAGGLIRAYSHAAVLGLDAATTIAMTPFLPYAITVDYSLLAALQNYLRRQGVRMREPDYAENVTLHLLLEPEQQEKILTSITDLTSGKFQQKKDEPVLIPVKVDKRLFTPRA